MTFRQWLRQNNVQYIPYNIRTWGTYDLKISMDGYTWVSMPRSFGRAIDEETAFEMVLQSLRKNPHEWNQIIQWIGSDKAAELLQSLDCTEETISSSTSIVKYVPSNTHNG